MAYFSVADLSSEEQQILVNVRQKKNQLLDEIQVFSGFKYFYFYKI